MRQDRTHDPRMQEPKRRKGSYLLVVSGKSANEHLEKYTNRIQDMEVEKENEAEEESGKDEDSE